MTGRTRAGCKCISDKIYVNEERDMLNKTYVNKR